MQLERTAKTTILTGQRFATHLKVIAFAYFPLYLAQIQLDARIELEGSGKYPRGNRPGTAVKAFTDQVVEIIGIRE